MNAGVGDYACVCVPRNNVSHLEKGLEQAKIQLKAIVKQVQSFLDMNQVISAGPFLYAFVQEVRHSSLAQESHIHVQYTGKVPL